MHTMSVICLNIAVCTTSYYKIKYIKLKRNVSQDDIHYMTTVPSCNNTTHYDGMVNKYLSHIVEFIGSGEMTLLMINPQFQPLQTVEIALNCGFNFLN